jgi:hypothetical protein
LPEISGTRTRRELWNSLSLTGNWGNRRLDANGDGDFTDADDEFARTQLRRQLHWRECDHLRRLHHRPLRLTGPLASTRTPTGRPGLGASVGSGLAPGGVAHLPGPGAAMGLCIRRGGAW